jgi:hypothetical protein
VVAVLLAEGAANATWLQHAAEEGEGRFLDESAVRGEIASPTYLGGLFNSRTCANMSAPVTVLQPLARAVAMSGVIAGAVMTQPTNMSL